MSKRGENIYKRKDGRWEGRYIKHRTAEGKAVYGYVYARTYKETRLKLKTFSPLSDVPKPLRTEQLSSPCFYILAEEWFCHIKPLTKESTYRKYRNLWNSYIRAELGDIQFSEITQDVLENYCVKLLTTGGSKNNGLSPKTVSDTLSLIRNIFQFCTSRKMSAPCDTRAITIKQHTKEMRVFTMNEQKIICDYIYSDLCLPNIGILICLFTGIRIGEVCALKWEDISFSEKTMRIHQTMQRIQKENPDGTDGPRGSRTKIIITTPKSKCSIRTIPLPEDLIQVLQSFKASGEGASLSGYFLTGSDKKWIEPRTMQNHFKRLLERCSIENANYHVLRHTFATRCVELGFDIKSLSEILGHASVNITMNRYVHPSMQLKKENMQRLSGLFAVR